MRIAVDARPLVHPTTGIGRYTRALLARLAAGTHEILLYSHAPLSPDRTFGLGVRHGRGASPALSTLYAQTHFARWARHDRADLFWSPRHHLPVGLGDMPSVVTIHDLVWRLYPETMIRLGRLAEAWLMPRALRQASSVIAVSNATARDLDRFYPDVSSKVVVIPEASDLEPPALVPCTRGDPYLLFVGTMEPRKNLGAVLEAFSRLRTRGVRSHRLVIAGNAGWKTRDLERALRATEGVELVGSPDDERLASLYAGAAAVVVPSLYEGFGLPVAEAMSFGIPVITSTVSSLPEVAGDAALLVDPASSDAIADAMQRIIAEPELRAELARRGKARAAELSWERAAAATLEVFEGVGRTRNSPGRR